tara:strand:- start:12651 stop:13676 length:1026 start_codon:yes stop_codon:yes gene_type:complete
MPSLHEIDALAKPDSWADLIAVVESDKTPFTSMLKKVAKPNQVVHQWQCKKFKNIGFNGVLDGKDATEFDSNQGQELVGVSQKVWYNVGVSDFMEEVATVAGVKGSHFNGQISEGIKVLSRSIEKRCLSNEDVSRDNGVSTANETRGILKWSDNNFATGYSVPNDFQTPEANKYSGTMANFFENDFSDQGISCYKERKGPGKMDGFLGIELKKRFTEFTSYQAPATASGPAVAGAVPVRRFNFGDGSTLTNIIDRLVLDSGTYDLHSTSFLRCDPVTGDDTAYTHKSGIFLDMDMVSLAYTRMPRVTKLDYQGGGHKAIIDAIFMLTCDNPLTMLPVTINN